MQKRVYNDLPKIKEDNIKIFKPSLKISAYNELENSNNKDINSNNLENNINNCKEINNLIIYNKFNLYNYWDINLPNNNNILSTNKIRFNNKFLYHYILNHENIPKTEVNEFEINKDENCYYNNISYYFTKKQIYNKFFLKLIYDFIQDNKNEIIIENPYTIDNDDNNIKIFDYIKNINKEGFYAGDLEISKTINILNINIAIYKNMNKYYEYINYYFNENTCFINDIILSF